MRAALFGEEKTPDRLRWGLVAEDGDRLTIELGPRTQLPGNLHVHLTLTCPDAFTIERMSRAGLTEEQGNRFVRAGRPPPAVP